MSVVELEPGPLAMSAVVQPVAATPLSELALSAMPSYWVRRKRAAEAALLAELGALPTAEPSSRKL